MEPVEKVVAKVHQQAEVEGKKAEEEGSKAQKQPETGTQQLALVSRPSEVKGSKQRKTLIFRDVEVASDRLCQFNLFCLQN